MDSAQLARTSAILGFTGSFFYSGVAFCSSQVALPILYNIPIEFSTSAFAEFYYRGIPVVAPLSLISSATFAYAAYLDPSRRTAYAAAAAFSLAPMPFTALLLSPTNSQLIEMSKDVKIREKAGKAAVVGLLQHWKFMNFLRSGMAGLGGVIGLMAFLGEI